MLRRLEHKVFVEAPGDRIVSVGVSWPGIKSVYTNSLKTLRVFYGDGRHDTFLPGKLHMDAIRGERSVAHIEHTYPRRGEYTVVILCDDDDLFFDGEG